jgi:hypothetical protein
LYLKTSKAEPLFDKIMEWFDVSREQVVTMLEFAARSLYPLPPPQVPTTSMVNGVCGAPVRCLSRQPEQ